MIYLFLLPRQAPTLYEIIYSYFTKIPTIAWMYRHYLNELTLKLLAQVLSGFSTSVCFAFYEWFNSPTNLLFFFKYKYLIKVVRCLIAIYDKYTFNLLDKCFSKIPRLIPVGYHIEKILTSTSYFTQCLENYESLGSGRLHHKSPIYYPYSKITFMKSSQGTVTRE